jgi:hypothetical protein
MSFKSIPVKVILTPLMNGEKVGEAELFDGEFNRLTWRVNEIANHLSAKHPDSYIGIEIEDQKTDAVLLYQSKKYYDIIGHKEIDSSYPLIFDAPLN